MATQRDGFKNGNPGGSDNGNTATGNASDHIKGTTGADTLSGQGGDDVIIGFRGNDILVGGTGHDDLSGSKGDDSLVGGDWADSDGDGIEIGNWTLTDPGADTVSTTDDVYTFTREFTQDSDTDHYVAEDSFEENGTDTIYGYDEAMDVIQISALQAGYDTLDFLDDGLYNDSVDAADLEAAGYITYDDSTGELMVDLDGGGDNYDTWFIVKTDDTGLTTGDTNLGGPDASDWSNADSVMVQIGDQTFSFT